MTKADPYIPYMGATHTKLRCGGIMFSIASSLPEGWFFFILHVEATSPSGEEIPFISRDDIRL